MRKMRLTSITLLNLLLAFLLLQNTSCAAALVGGMFYKSSKSKEAKQKFMTNFQQTNLEREKAGLEPLDLCTEKYYFDEGWAKDDPDCKARVERYEAGDTKALTHQQLKTNQQNSVSDKAVEN
jgi:hypothetical protein